MRQKKTSPYSLPNGVSQEISLDLPRKKRDDAHSRYFLCEVPGIARHLLKGVSSQASPLCEHVSEWAGHDLMGEWASEFKTSLTPQSFANLATWTLVISAPGITLIAWVSFNSRAAITSLGTTKSRFDKSTWSVMAIEE
jgi:hypothetical protein